VSNYWNNDADPYLYEGSTTLKNLFDIKDTSKLEHLEKNLTEINSIEVNKFILNKEINFNLWKAIHRILFKELYTWAGEIRTVQLGKEGAMFAHPENILKQGDKIFNQLAQENYLQGLKEKNLAKRLAYYFGELNALHPFREGNGRTQKLLFSELVRRLGYKLSWKDLSGNDHVIAIKESFWGQNQKLEQAFERILLQQ